jgi:hypothetical protein
METCFPKHWHQPTKPHGTKTQDNSRGRGKLSSPRNAELQWEKEAVNVYGTTVVASIGLPGMRVKHCAYGHSTATLLNPRGVTTVSHKYCIIAARHATV